MIAPSIPTNELQRQQAVEKYDLLDTMPEDRYDNITAIIASICDAPIALITLLDKQRNFLKSRHGVPLSESPREISFCGHAILEDEIMIVKDARLDPRFKGNPLVTGLTAIFYAGAPLIDSNGYKLGTLCVYDHRPRDLSASQTKALKAMAKQVMLLFEERYTNMQLTATKLELEHRNKELTDFAGIVSHDLKAPLSNIKMTTTLLKSELNNKDVVKAMEYTQYLDAATTTMSTYIDGMLTFYRSEDLITGDYTSISFIDLMEDLITLSKIDESVDIIYAPDNELTIKSNEVALQHILLNLITNAIKYNDKEQVKIQIDLNVCDAWHTFSVKDNGMGIASSELKNIFKLFHTTTNVDKEGKTGTGIGLATVAKIIKSMNGTIDVTSTQGVGSHFIIKLPLEQKKQRNRCL